MNEDSIKSGNIIKFSLEHGKINYKLTIDESREIYTNELYDVTIIEIKKEDKLDNISFFDIDNMIFKENNKENFKNNSIFLLHYPENKGMALSHGTIKSISKNHIIQHLCNTRNGLSGAPIINSANKQVIGVHKGGVEGICNFGILLKEPIKEFIEQYKKNIEKKKLIALKINV